MVDFYVNGRLLDQARFAKEGDVIYEHDVPIDWLKTGSLTTVRMRVHNPYVAPRDGATPGSAIAVRRFPLAPAGRRGRCAVRGMHLKESFRELQMPARALEDRT